MANKRAMMFLSAVSALMAACGGGEGRQARFDGPSMAEPAPPAQRVTIQVAATAAPAAPVSPPARQGPLPAVAAVPAGGPPTKGRFNPQAIPAAQIAGRLNDFANARVDEASCTRGDISCDETYSAPVHTKLRGNVGRTVTEDRQVHFDREDIVQLPAVATPVSIFIQSGTASRNALHVTLEDRLGNRLYTLGPVSPGASTAFGWSRTDDPAAAPLRLRLAVPIGPGEHSVDYLVLPVLDAQWSADPQRLSRAP